MSQDMERAHSQGSLASPVEILENFSPIPRASLSASPMLSLVAGSHASQSERSKYTSPPPLSSSEMTPPPSSQVPGAPPRHSRSRSHSRSTNSYLASPPDLERTLCAAYGASENLPTIEEIETATETRLRTISKELLGVAQDARMSALHFKLQHSLLSFTSNEAIKRAEVEHHLARREVEILQSSEYRNRFQRRDSKPSQPNSNAELTVALARIQELERANATLDRRLRRAKKLIENEQERFELLAEENSLLKKRIRDNREHFSRMFDHSSLSPGSPSDMRTPQRRSTARFPDSHQATHPSESHDPFAALLAADQMLNRESASLASTPNPYPVSKHQNQGHVRGTQSMSSLPTTPARGHVVCPENEYLTPANNLHRDHEYGYSQIGGALEERDRHDRDSTISASDAEEIVSDFEDGLASHHVDTRATGMIGHHPPTSEQHESPSAAPVSKSNILFQTKLFGKVRKGGVGPPPSSLKRRRSSEEYDIAAKKSKAADGIGLGIEA